MSEPAAEKLGPNENVGETLRVTDLVAIGVGPANLSLGALLTTAKERGQLEPEWALFDERPLFDWHDGQLFPASLMQSEWYRDLVTPVDPTSRFSFLNYLHQHGRLFRFINSGIRLPERSEFTTYLRWVAREISPIYFNHRCTRISYDPQMRALACDFQVNGNASKTVHTRNVVVGVGKIPRLPTGITESQGVVHVAHFFQNRSYRDANRVLIVGGGQSGAEAFLYFLEEPDLACNRLSWITRDTNFRILDTGNFAREFYSPGTAKRFSELPIAVQKTIGETDRAAGEGISPAVCEKIYRALYRLEYEPSRLVPRSVSVASLKSLTAIQRDDNALDVVFRDEVLGEDLREVFDLVVLCTGFEDRELNCLAPLLLPSGHRSSPDYSIDGNKFDGCKIYVQSRSIESHGLGDPNLVVSAARSATIIKQIFGVDLGGGYDFDSFLRW
jgi:lysine N6-hydroxylase